MVIRTGTQGPISPPPPHTHHPIHHTHVIPKRAHFEVHAGGLVPGEEEYAASACVGGPRGSHQLHAVRADVAGNEGPSVNRVLVPEQINRVTQRNPAPSIQPPKVTHTRSTKMPGSLAGHKQQTAHTTPCVQLAAKVTDTLDKDTGTHRTSTQPHTHR